MAKSEKITESPYFIWTFRIIALFLAWRCNRHELTIMKLLYLFIAYILSYYYVAFYVLYHYVLRYPCANQFGSPGVLMANI